MWGIGTEELHELMGCSGMSLDRGFTVGGFSMGIVVKVEWGRGKETTHVLRQTRLAEDCPNPM